jgi:4-amino-4-deoxy-L-arabinose transferase-like glycosyltransferase
MLSWESELGNDEVKCGSYSLSRTVAIALAAALVVRLVFALGYWVEKPLTHDEQEYLELAENLAAGRGLHYDRSDPDTPHVARFGRAPLYPACLAGVRLVSTPEHFVRNVRIAQAFVGMIAVAIIAALARRAAGARAGAGAAVIAAVYPPLALLPAYALSETLYTALALGTVLWLARAFDGTPAPIDVRHSSWLVVLGGGILAGLSALTRPAMLIFLAIGALWLLARRQWLATAALALGALLVVAPWTVRNYREYGRVILIASEGGVTFWTGNHPLSPGEGDMAANPAIKLANYEFRRAHPGLSEEQLEPLFYRDAFRTIAERPGWWLGLLARKLFYTIVPVGPSYTLHSGRYIAAVVLPYLIVLPFGVLGLRRLRAEGVWPRTLVMLAGSAVLVSLIFFPQERFRIPVIDPALIVAAAAWRSARAAARGAQG